MADRIAESGELAVDELRRKARRRLVGAIVLALAAAIVVPMLLENEPRPLGDDVSVQIPSRDEGRFVNRLTGAAPDSKSAKTAAPRSGSESAATPQAPAVPPAPPSTSPTQDAANPPSADATSTPPHASEAAAKRSVAEAEQRVLAPSRSGQKSVPEAKTASQAKPAPDRKAVTEPKVAPETPAAAELKPAPEPKTNTEPKAAAELNPAATAPAGGAPAATLGAPAPGGFAVQLAAFTDDKGANALANKLKRANYAAYVEPVNTSRGMLWRVRVGGYATRDEANAARVKLKDEGYSGIVTAAK